MTMDTAMERLFAGGKDALLGAPENLALARQAMQRVIDWRVN